MYTTIHINEFLKWQKYFSWKHEAKSNILFFCGYIYYESMQNKISTCTKFTQARWNPKLRQKSRKGFIIFYNILNLKGAYVIHVCILLHMCVQVYTIQNYIIMYTKLHIVII